MEREKVIQFIVKRIELRQSRENTFQKLKGIGLDDDEIEISYQAALELVTPDPEPAQEPMREEDPATNFGEKNVLLNFW